MIGNASAVIELPAGTVEKMGITKGNIVKLEKY